MNFFRQTYFIRSQNFKEGTDEVLNTNWTVLELAAFNKLVHWVNEYRHEQENQFGGVCMIEELRRV